MKAFIFQHMTSNGPGTLLKILEARGMACRVINTAVEDLSGFRPLEPDLLVVLGGSPGVYQAYDYPFLKEERRILESRLAQDKPTLGICLGAQLMAAALGEKVHKGSQGPEIGWHDLDLTETGKQSPVRYFGGPQTKVMQWHGDTFDLPADAMRLAGSKKYPNQIFSYGRNALAFQPHIEVTAPILADWFVEGAGSFVEDREALHRLRKDTGQYAQVLENATQSFMKEWMARILPEQEKQRA